MCGDIELSTGHFCTNPAGIAPKPGFNSTCKVDGDENSCQTGLKCIGGKCFVDLGQDCVGGTAPLQCVDGCKCELFGANEWVCLREIN